MRLETGKTAAPSFLRLQYRSLVSDYRIIARQNNAVNVNNKKWHVSNLFGKSRGFKVGRLYKTEQQKMLP